MIQRCDAHGAPLLWCSECEAHFCIHMMPAIEAGLSIETTPARDPGPCRPRFMIAGWLQLVDERPMVVTLMATDLPPAVQTRQIFLASFN